MVLSVVLKQVRHAEVFSFPVMLPGDASPTDFLHLPLRIIYIYIKDHGDLGFTK